MGFCLVSSESDIAVLSASVQTRAPMGSHCLAFLLLTQYRQVGCDYILFIYYPRPPPHFYSLFVKQVVNIVEGLDTALCSQLDVKQ